MTTPIPVGVQLKTDFLHTTPSLLQSAFTISVFKNGVAGSNAGITITYVSGLEYSVVVDGTLGFVNSAGSYTLIISLTADTSKTWSQSWIVTPDVYQVQGGFKNPIATYVTSTGNCRVTDGSNPIQNAVVTVTRPNGSILTQKITDVNGLFGTLVFDTTGTFLVAVQANGYQAGTATISVSGSTATGPGTDIALSAITSIGTLSASSLWAYARRMFQDRIGTKSDAEIKDAVNEALWMVASVKDWQWYETSYAIRYKGMLTSPNATLTLDSAIVTFASAIPSWVDETCDIKLPDGQWYPILTQDSSTQITLTTPWPIASTVVQCEIAKSKYDLPSDCKTIIRPMTSDTWLWGNQPVSPATIEMMKRRIQTFSPAWAVEKNKLCLWPMYSTDKTAVLLYQRRPQSLSISTDVADFDEKQLELLRRAIDFQIACRGNCVAGDRVTCLNAFKEALGRNAPNDTGLQSPEPAPPALGFNPMSAFYGRVS